MSGRAIHAAVEALTRILPWGLYTAIVTLSKYARIIGKFDARQNGSEKLQRGYVNIPQQAFFFRGALWKKVGPLDESIYFAMDYDLWLRLARIAPFRLYTGRRSGLIFVCMKMAKTLPRMHLVGRIMIQIRRRDGGSKFSVLFLNYHCEN
jgi:hypothetical protein